MMVDHDGRPLRTGRAAVNGTSLHYRTAGSGPAVVLLHGVPKTGYHWRHLVKRLTPHHTVVVPDLRGLGGLGAARGRLRLGDDEREHRRAHDPPRA
jgi:Dipeptidyl aminopeptidases/acylaminoacyl-peptidases